MQNLPDFSVPLYFLLLVAGMFVVVVGRYFLVAGLFQLFFNRWFKHQWQHRKLTNKAINRKQFITEVKWSLVTSLIFSVIGAATAVLWQNGYTRLYSSPAAYGYWYLPVSLIISMLIHETYYYFLHRWMHKPKVFKVLHKVHHDSKVTSAWTAFSFHPLEGLLQAIILPLTLLFLPMHMYVLVVQLTIMSLSSVINHLEIEVYPSFFHSSKVGRWLIGATHHSLHHKQYKYNFGLYFTFWDRWANTESPAFDDLFLQKKSRDRE